MPIIDQKQHRDSALILQLLPLSFVDTALAVAYCKSLPLLRDGERADPLASDILEGRGSASALRMGLRGSKAVSHAVRGVVFDELIRNAVAASHIQHIVTLGAGYDTRPLRIRSDRPLHFLDADLAEVVAERERLLGKHPLRPPNWTQIEGDLRKHEVRARLYARIRALNLPTVVVCEGLLVYWSENEVARLAKELAEVPAVRTWIIDFVGSAWRKSLPREIHPLLPERSPRHAFAVSDPGTLFASAGWRTARVHYGFDSVNRLGKLGPGLILARMLLGIAPDSWRDRIRNAHGVLALERAC